MKYIYLIVIGVLLGLLGYKWIEGSTKIHRLKEQNQALTDSLGRISTRTDTVYDSTWRHIALILRGELLSARRHVQFIHKPQVPQTAQVTPESFKCTPFEVSDSLIQDDIALYYTAAGIGKINDFGISYQVKTPTVINTVQHDCPPPVVCPKQRKGFVFAAVGYDRAFMVGAGAKIAGGFSLLGAAHVSAVDPQRASALIGIQFAW